MDQQNLVSRPQDRLAVSFLVPLGRHSCVQAKIDNSVRAANQTLGLYSIEFGYPRLRNREYTIKVALL